MRFPQNWNECPEHTLVHCITQSFVFINTILKVSENSYFLILSKKSLLLWEMSGCLPGLTISTLKAMQVKNFGWTTRTFSKRKTSVTGGSKRSKNEGARYIKAFFVDVLFVV